MVYTTHWWWFWGFLQMDDASSHTAVNWACHSPRLPTRVARSTSELGWICCWEISSSQLPDPLNSGIILTWRWICWTVLGWIWIGHTLINAMQVQSPCSASCTCCGSNPGLQLQCTVWHWSPLAEMVVSCGFTWREGLVIIILDEWFASNIMYYRNQDTLW